MEPATVIGLVTALVETYADGLEDYTAWKRKRSAMNHYEGKGSPSTFCALTTTLTVSGPQIKETYDNALFIVGSEFSTGDSCCRSMLWAQLNVLSDRVANLHRAAASNSALVDLADCIKVCEGVRRASLQALAEQYQRLAAGRPIAKTLIIPKPRMWSYQRRQHYLEPLQPRELECVHELDTDVDDDVDDDGDDPMEEDDDKMTTAMTVCSGPLRFQSEPPSPPPTPKVSDNLSEVGGPGGSSLMRPTNSVFALFCPEAMSLQVNLKLALPACGTKCSSCGYKWRPSEQQQQKSSGGTKQETSAFLLKEGFKLTDRYLAKSHTGADGYGCVLCTSTGKSERYLGVEQLRDHINTCHSKWQLLHDVDCRTKSSSSSGSSTGS